MFKKIIHRLFDIHPNAISFKEGMDLTGLPICTFSQGDKRLNFILDTGSDVSIIDSNILDQIEHSVLEDTEGNLYGVDGVRTKVPVCTITLNYRNKDYPGAFLVRNMKEAFGNMKNDHGVNLHGLIGSRFFNQYKYVLDFADLIAYSKE